MPKTKTKDWKQKNFSLERDIIEKIFELAKFEDMNESEFIGFLVSNWDSGINPEAKLNHLLKDREKIVSDVARIDLEIKKVSDQISVFNQWRKQKGRKKTDALKILERLIRVGDFEESERISKTWQRMTGISCLELLMEAKNNVEKSGI